MARRVSAARVRAIYRIPCTRKSERSGPARGRFVVSVVVLVLVGGPSVAEAQARPQLAAPRADVSPPAPIAGLTDARPYAPLEFSRAWLAKVARVRARRNELMAEGRLAGLAPAHAAWEGAALAGVLRIPVIPVRYADVRTPFPHKVLVDRLFGESTGDTVTYRGYWSEVSNGLLQVDGAVSPWIRLPERARHYLPAAQHGWARFGRISQLREEALSGADDYLDFRQFDNDGPDGKPNSGDDDGFVDFVAFVYAVSCPGDGREGGIWPHRAAMAPVETRDMGKNGRPIKVADYVILPAVDPATCGPMHIGLLAHETGHALGLPDLYDYDGSSQGIGHWGLMGTGSHGELFSPAHPSAWEKEQLGWVGVVWIDDDSASLEIPPVEREPTVYRYDIPDGRGRYLLLENRQRLGSDRMLPGHGLLVWRVDPERGELGAWNSDERRKAVGLVEADGLGELALGLDADDGDPFPGATDQRSHHSWLDHSFRLSDIVEADETIKARVGGGPRPALLPKQPVVRLTALQGGAKVRHEIEIERTAGAGFSFTLATAAPWLAASSSGDTVVVTADPTSLEPGGHADTVRLLDGASATAARIVVSFHVARPGIGQIVATELPWSWGLAAKDGHILQASFGWDQLGLRPRPRVLELWEGATHPVTLARIPSDALYSPAIDTAGTSYVLARANGENLLYRLGADGSAEVVTSSVGTGPAYGAASLPDGSILVSEWNGRINRVTQDGTVTVWDTVPAQLYQIATDASGAVFAATYSGDVLRIGPEGVESTIVTGFGPGRLVAIAATPDGSVFAAERGGLGRVERIDPTGRRHTVFQRDGAHFYGVAVDGAFLYALDLSTRQLLRIPLPATTEDPPAQLEPDSP